MPTLPDLFTFFGNGSSAIFGTGIILGLVVILIYFYLAYKFEFPAVLTLIVVGLTAALISNSIFVGWAKGIVLIILAVMIAIFGYRIVWG